ncbi:MULTISPECIES: NADPH-dependent FMN reductase [Myroides]|uniref:NADPH-dependent oxidoreductase n=1 Tax=Myroides albus TaxID=2562892 RepID=A0A6I3LHY9_9FLAO|nr:MULTISPECIES: NAD(P)H-dependent oxidoreductase [Myroides]MTG97863.1 NADPH-dependent oxidoreductase [Myroides albus]MVX36832.1 NADPH-dependent oxidoreductase [Myroides sp. LoEW2-1]UVD79820.1 NAD(P)H-dependent oxidoreductase [Myroides albus]
MKALIFNGSLDEESFRTSRRIAQYYADQFIKANVEVQQIHLSDYQIPIFQAKLMQDIPDDVLDFANAFRSADIMIWLTPLYHGSLTGVMKNAIDWLEITSKDTPAYLTNKVVGFTCWSAGNQAMQGIQSLDNIAKALRAWSLPYSIPISNMDLYENNDISEMYKNKMNMLTELLIQSKQ